MTFGEQVLGELQRRALRQRFRYADIQALKAVTTPGELRARLEKRGFRVGPERTEALHFADLIEIEILRRRLDGAKAALVLFAIG